MPHPVSLCRMQVLLEVFSVAVGLALPGCGGDTPGSSPESSIQVTGLPTSVMNYHAAKQRAGNWCWAACVQMALSAKGIEVDQAEVVRNAFGSLVDRPGSPLDILANLNGWTMTRSGSRVFVSTQFSPGPPTFETLKLLLDSGTPVIVGYDNPGIAVGHAVVITAVVYELTPQGPTIHRVLVRDPWPEFSGTHGKRELSGAEFDRVREHYVIVPVEQ